MLNALEAAYHPYVRDRGLDWEIHIEQVSYYFLSRTRQMAAAWQPLMHIASGAASSQAVPLSVVTLHGCWQI